MCDVSLPVLPQESGEFHPVVVGRAVLTRLHRSEVVVKRWGAPIGNQYYRSVMPDFPISLCRTCNKVSDPHSTLMAAHHEHVYTVIT